ncbi:DUF6234 family protein [Streptomyces milbemycinicus]|uniref:DUF6234 family protein n=1 Tax=Streptomyces milbemycinicus TaxID=476552 RepID=UPI0033D7717D
MTDPPGRGCAGCVVVAAQLVLVAMLFVGAWAEEYFSWDPQYVPGSVGPYIVKMGVVAVVAAVAGVVAGVRGAGAAAYRQAVVVVITLIAMAVTNAMGESAHKESHRRECYSTPAAPECADVR